MVATWANCMVVSFLFRHGRQRERLQVGGPEQLREHTDHSIQCTLRQAIEFISRFIICVFCTSSDLTCTALKVAMRALQRPVWLRPMPAQPAQPPCAVGPLQPGPVVRQRPYAVCESKVLSRARQRIASSAAGRRCTPAAASVRGVSPGTINLT